MLYTVLHRGVPIGTTEADDPRALSVVMVRQLAGFEARYRTLGDLEIGVFRQTRTGTAVVLTTGICDLATRHLTLDDLAKVRAMIHEAKTRLDELR